MVRCPFLRTLTAIWTQSLAGQGYIFGFPIHQNPETVKSDAALEVI